MSPEDAEEYTQATEQVMSGGWRVALLAERLGVCAALGLNVRQWQQRIGGFVRYSIPERQEAVAEMVAEGLTQREIADVLGVGNGTVARDVAELLAPNGAAESESESAEQDEPEDVAPNGAAEPPPLEESMAKLDQAATLTDVLQAERAEREAAEQSARETSTTEMNELRDACRRLLDVLIVIDHLPAHEQTEAEDWLRELKKELERHA